MSFVWNPLTFALNPSLDLDFWVIWWWVTGRRGRLRPNALDSIHKKHLRTGKLYQPQIKGFELILGLGPHLGGVYNWYWPSLGDWLDLRLWHMSQRREEVTSTWYWVSFLDISCLFFDFSQWFNYFGVYDSSAFGHILPLCPVNHYQD